MGEVYRGYDERLDRQVALKRVRLGVRDPETALKRLQREARAVARLRHPAIVQVHDWVETEDGAWLVMELVEGYSLREILSAGPLEPSRVSQIARDLLEGLDAAHEAGLVHRDLKAENIMITPGSSSGLGRGERAKILDFGLAKKTTPDLGDTQLSVEGKILGTLSAMAPEQVLGEPMDGRTDLFALGCMLYEALTTVPPFIGSNAGETLNRICTQVQFPAHEVRTEVPESLSNFVDHLLEKDIRRRPASAFEALELLETAESGALDSLDSLAVEDFATQPESLAGASLGTETLEQTPPGTNSGAGARDGAGETYPKPNPSRRGILPILVMVLVFLAAGMLWNLRPNTPVGPIYIAIPKTVAGEEASSEEELAAQAIHATLVQGLVDLRDVVPLEVPTDHESGTDPRDLARTLAADEILISRLHCRDQGCRAELRRVDGNDGSILWAESFSADPTRPLDLSQAVLGYLPGAFPDHEPRESTAEFEVRPEDYETYLRLRQRFLDPDKSLSRESLPEELAQLGLSSPRFVAIPVLEAHVALFLFQGSHDPAALERASQALARARALAPEDPQVLLLAARVARSSRDLDSAEELLDTLHRLEPGNMEARLQRALVHEAQGEFEEAVALALEASQRLPSLYMLLSTSDLLSRRGDFAGARSLIEQGLERDPESFDGLTRLAQLELAHGDLQRAADLYSDLVERSPGSYELINLGTALMMLGRFEEAIACFEQEAAKSPDSPFAALSLADVKKLGGDPEGARILYAKVVELAAADPRPERLESIRAQALAHLGERERAVEAIQAAIQRRPEHPWTAYQASLVYVLIDEPSSALWNARRALEAGIEPRWFGLSWFDPIREGLDGKDLAVEDQV